MTAGRAVVVGASGQVGGALMERLGRDRALGTFRLHRVDNAVRFDLEKTAENPLYARRLLCGREVRTVYMPAAMAWVDGCEDDPEQTMKVNRDAPAALAALCAEEGIRFVYYSTDYVFDGVDGPYSEEAQPRPLSVYGRSKLKGEQAVLEANPAALVIRTTVVYGPELQGKNFAYRLVSALQAGKTIRVPTDQYSTPIYNRDLAKASVLLARSNVRGIVNVSGKEFLSRTTFAQRIAHALGLDADLIEPVLTTELGQKASRPLRTGLKGDKLRGVLPGSEPRSVDEALGHWLNNQRGKPWP